jgi:MFS family permease
MAAAHSSMLPVAVTTLTIYAAGFLQGMTLVSFPASATVLKDTLDFTDAQYGLIFIPQIAATILSSLAGGGLVRRLGLSRLLVAALLANALSQLGLGAAVQFPDSRSGFHLVLCSTAMLGLAFGAGAAPLNTYPGLLFPRRKDTALVALHTLLGIGLAAGPLALRTFTAAGAWVGYPAVLILLSMLLLVALLLSSAPACAPFEEQGVGQEGSTGRRNPLRATVFWVFAGIAVLYAFAGLACSAFFPLTVGLVSRVFPDSAAWVSSLMIAALMLGVGIGSFVIGPLRAGLSLERLYVYSAVYPAGAFLLAVGVVARSWRSADIRSRTCRMIFGRPC